MKIAKRLIHLVVIFAFFAGIFGFAAKSASAGDIMPGPRRGLAATRGDIMPGPR